MLRFYLCMCVVSVTAGAQLAQSQTMAVVTAKVATQRTMGADRLPAAQKPPSGTPSPYYSELNFTIIALSSQSFADLFAPDATALSIVSKWQENINDSDDPSISLPAFDNLKTELGELIGVLNSSNNYKNLFFSHMVDRRLQNKLVADGMPELENALDELLGVHFQFPLFRKPTGGVTYADIMTLLHTLCEKHFMPGVNDGGFGNLSWDRLFYTPADPVNFTDAKLTRTLMATSGRARMQGHILPSPNPRFMAFVQEDFEAYFDAAGFTNDKCCCNFNTDHPNHYRKCVGPLYGSECSTCGGTYCCLAGVQWCPSAASHPYP